MNKGITGVLTKTFPGRDFFNDMDSAMDGIKQQQWQAQSGLDATADVLSIAGTGTLVNMNPVVVLALNVQPSIGGVVFDTAGHSMVSKIAIPRVGDKTKIKNNPADPTQFVVI